MNTNGVQIVNWNGTRIALTTAPGARQLAPEFSPEALKFFGELATASGVTGTAVQTGTQGTIVQQNIQQGGQGTVVVQQGGNGALFQQMGQQVTDQQTGNVTTPKIKLRGTDGGAGVTTPAPTQTPPADTIDFKAKEIDGTEQAATEKVYADAQALLAEKEKALKNFKGTDEEKLQAEGDITTIRNEMAAMKELAGRDSIVAKDGDDADDAKVKDLTAKTNSLFGRLTTAGKNKGFETRYGIAQKGLTDATYEGKNEVKSKIEVDKAVKNNWKPGMTANEVNELTIKDMSETDLAKVKTQLNEKVQAESDVKSFQDTFAIDKDGKLALSKGKTSDKQVLTRLKANFPSEGIKIGETTITQSDLTEYLANQALQ